MGVLLRMNNLFRLSHSGGYTYVTIGSAKLAYYGIDLVGFTSRNGGCKLPSSLCFPGQNIDAASSHAELEARAMLAIANTSTAVVERLVDDRITKSV